MRSYSTEFKVGLFTVVIVAVLSFFLLQTRDAPFGPGKSYTVYAFAPSAEGLAFGNQVMLAGVRVGRVGAIDLVEGKARLALELNREVELPKDSRVTLRTMGMLGDKTVALLPGIQTEIMPPGSVVPYATPQGDLDTLTQQLGAVATDVKKVTENLKAITDELRGTVEGGDLTASVKDILTNLEGFTATLKQVGGTNQDDLAAIVRNIRDVSQSLKDILGSSQQVIEGSGKQVSDQISTLQAATARLDEVLSKVSAITGKVEAGEGTIGALLTERDTIDNINDVVVGANDLLERVNKLTTTVRYEGDFYALGGADRAGGMKNTLSVTLANRPDYYYTFALVSDPVMDSTVKVVVSDNGTWNRQERVYTDAYQVTFQFARRWRDLALRLGIRENHGGVGADYFFWKDRFALSADVYDFDSGLLRATDELKTRPVIELKARLNFYDHLYVSAGLDDIWNRLDQTSGPPVNLMIGAGFSFRDDDLKFLLSYLPIPK